jgi:serine/threonine protein kinase
MHENHYLHRDIKPANFVLGRRKDHETVFLIDFGLSRKYRDAATSLHISGGCDQSFLGTSYYASVHLLLQLTPSRRDDLEAWVYCVIEMMKGELPWENLSKGKIL